MINASTITASLKTTFEAALSGFRVERGDYVNRDPHRTPWLGIYRTRVKYNPRTLGRHANSLNGEVTVRLMVQATHHHSGADCEDLLEGYITQVLDAMWSDPTWNSVVDTITEFSVEYSYKESELETIYFQWALITITAEVSTG